VQHSLNQLQGLNLPIDGIMSPAARSALRRFQEQHGFPVDGIAGPETERALMDAKRSQPVEAGEPPAQGEFEALELDEFEWEEEVNRSSSEYAKWVQSSLNKILGLKLAVDGIIGTQTRSAIRRFQSQKGLVVDGIVGPITEAALIAAGASPPPSVGSVPSPGTTLNVNTPLPLSGPGFYNKLGNSTRSYGLPETIHALQAIGTSWQRAHPQGPRIGIGDISFRGGGFMDPHTQHQKGLEADIRPVRNDGSESPVTYQSSQYSRVLTQELVNLMRNNSVLGVYTILFNDPAVSGVKSASGHDDHLHLWFVEPSALPSYGLVPPSGTIAARIVAEARNHIGYDEGPNNQNKFSEYFGVPNVPWCAYFVSYVHTKAGVPLKFGSCGKMLNYLLDKDKFFTTTPQPGDIVVFDWTLGDHHPAEHVGIVEDVKHNSAGQLRVQTIEGNSSKGVNRRDYPFGDRRIVGYGRFVS
jgi:peptidoglycan hydrolase-like protein with peptidoglycan-binding domain